MDTDVLRWFQQVADGATVTEVSDLEMVSQPAVSRGLQRLDRAVGTPLLQRHGRVLRLTQAGAVFKNHLDTALHHLDNGLAAVQQVMDPRTGTVAMVFQPSLGGWLVPDLIGHFRREHPGVDFSLVARTDESIPGLVEHPEAELELSSRRPVTDRYHWQPLAREALVLLVPAEHPSAGLDQVELSSLAEESFVMVRRTSSLRGLTEELCRQAGFEPSVALVADDLATLRGYVAAGLGIAVLPEMWAGTSDLFPDQMRALRILNAGAEREIGLSWAQDRRMLPVAEVFRDFVITRARSGLLP